MLEVVVALEGAIAPMECFHPSPEGKVSCSHETDGDDACATKLLWTRVHGGVAKALSGTTLADLVEFAEGRRQEHRRRRPQGDPARTSPSPTLVATAAPTRLRSRNWLS